MSREKQLVKNTLIISFGTIIPKLASVVTLPIITAGLTKPEYGTYDLINTLVSLFLPVLTLQIQAAAFRFLIEKRNDKEGTVEIISTILSFIVAISLAGLSALFLCLRNISAMTRLLVCMYFFVDTLVMALSQIVRGFSNNKNYSESAIVRSVVNLILIVITIKFWNMGLNGVLLAVTAAYMIGLIILLIRGGVYKYYSIKSFSNKMLKEMLQYSWPMIPNSMSLWVMNLSDRLIVTAVLGIEMNAVYAVANKIPSLFTVVQSTFTYAWQENASVASEDSDATEYYSSIFDRIYCLMIGIMAALIAATPVIFTVLIRGDYDESYYQMPLLFLGILFSTLASFLGGIYVAQKKTKSVGITTAISAGLNFLTNLCLIRMIGLYAASLSTMLSYAFLVFYRMHDVVKFQPMKFRGKKIAVTLAALSLMCILCFQRNIVCNVVNFITAIFLAFILNRELVSGLLKRYSKRN